MFSRSCRKLDMPESVTVTPGTVCRNRKAQAGIVSSGRRAFKAFSALSGSAASLPPRTGSMPHRGSPYSFSSPTLALASCRLQST